MKVTRQGAQRFRGTKEVIPDLTLVPATDDYSLDDNVRWDRFQKELVIGARWVSAGDGRTRHNYTIRLSLEDVSALITLVAHAGSASDASLLRDHLSEHVPALVKLLACATGLVPTAIPEPETVAVESA